MKGRKTGGRQKGTPNKVTGELRGMVLGALDDAGGQAYLSEQAKKNPAAFMTLLGKVLPLQLQGDKENPLVHQFAGAKQTLGKKLARLAPG